MAISGEIARDVIPIATAGQVTGSQIEMMQVEEPVTVQVPTVQRSKIRMIAILVGLFASLFIAALDQTIMATAAPTIAAQLNSAGGYIWIGGAYLLANAAGGSIWSNLSDIWGRKPILLIVVAIFAGSSIICALAVDMKMLIVGRAIQGAAGGGLLQLVNIVISDLFSMRSRSLYLGLLEFMWCLAGGSGPLLGGAFTQYASWRWCFWINLPISATTFLLLLLFLDVHNPRTSALDGFKAIDWFGSLSILGLTLMLLLGLDFGGATFPWSSPKVICLIVFGAVMSILFIYSEKRLARYPLMPMALFKDRSNVASLLVCFIHGMVFIAGEYYLPLMFQSVLSASPFHSGLLILPITISEALTGITTGILIHRTGRYLPLIWTGLLLLTLGNGLYITLSADTRPAALITFQLVAGLGAGLLFEPPLIALQARTAQAATASATATLGLVRNLATSASLVLGGVVFQNGMTLRAARLAADRVLPPEMAARFAGASAAANVLSVRAIADERQRRAVQEAFAWSLRNMWVLFTCLAAVGLLAAWGIRGEVLSREHTETVTGC